VQDIPIVLIVQYQCFYHFCGHLKESRCIDKHVKVHGWTNIGYIYNLLVDIIIT